MIRLIFPPIFFFFFKSVFPLPPMLPRSFFIESPMQMLSKAGASSTIVHRQSSTCHFVPSNPLQRPRLLLSPPRVSNSPLHLGQATDRPDPARPETAAPQWVLSQKLRAHPHTHQHNNTNHNLPSVFTAKHTQNSPNCQGTTWPSKISYLTLCKKSG